MGGGSNWLRVSHISQVIDSDTKIKAIMWYFFECDDYTQTFSSLHRDACSHKSFRGLHRFTTDYSFILTHMVKNGFLETWVADYQTYYRLSKKFRREANLKKLI